MEKLIVNIDKGNIREKHYVDVEGKQKHRRLTQDVDDILKLSEAERNSESGKGNRFTKLIRKGIWKKLGNIPATVFFGTHLCKEDRKESLKWLEEHSKYKSTNARII